MTPTAIKILGLTVGITASYFLHASYGGRYFTKISGYTVDGMTGDFFRDSERTILFASFAGPKPAPIPKPTQAEAKATFTKIEAEVAAEQVKVDAEAKAMNATVEQGANGIAPKQQAVAMPLDEGANKAEASTLKTGARSGELFTGILPKPDPSAVMFAPGSTEFENQVKASATRARAKYPSISSEPATAKELKAYIDSARESASAQQAIFSRSNWPEAIADEFFFNPLVRASYDRAFTRYPSFDEGGANHEGFQQYVDKNADISNANAENISCAQFPEKMAEDYAKLVGLKPAGSHGTANFAGTVASQPNFRPPASVVNIVDGKPYDLTPTPAAPTSVTRQDRGSVDNQGSPIQELAPDPKAFDAAVMKSRDRAYDRWPILEKEGSLRSLLLSWIDKLQSDPKNDQFFQQQNWPELLAEKFAKTNNLTPAH